MGWGVMWGLQKHTSEPEKVLEWQTHNQSWAPQDVRAVKDGVKQPEARGAARKVLTKGRLEHRAAGEGGRLQSP